MTWTGPSEVRGQVQRLWDRGEILSTLAGVEPIFPRRLSFSGPTSSAIAERFDDVRHWVADLRAMRYGRVEMREFRHPQLGANTVPRAIWIDSAENAVALIGKEREFAAFAAMVDATRTRQPQLLRWLARRPLQALSLAHDWDHLLDVVGWIQRHPRPGIYIRQMDIPAIHSKFVEERRGILAEMLELTLPTEAIDSTVPVTRFADRYGFRDKPVRVRFRMLDADSPLFPGDVFEDVTLDAQSFNKLRIRPSTVFITENEINFLAFPATANSLVIFGAGYGFETLSGVAWLAQSRICYWGDIDTHGFAILDQLRIGLPQAESFLMDRHTLMELQSMWGEEERQVSRDLPRLTAEERMLYDDLRDNRIRNNLRLEQERIGFGRVRSALSKLVA